MKFISTILILFIFCTTSILAQKKNKKTTVVPLKQKVQIVARPANVEPFVINTNGDTINVTDNYNLKQGLWVVQTAAAFNEPATRVVGNYMDGWRIGKWLTYQGAQLVKTENYKSDVLDGETQFFEDGYLTCTGYYLGINSKTKFDTVFIKQPNSDVEKQVVLLKYSGATKDSIWTFYYPSSKKISLIQYWNDDELVSEQAFEEVVDAGQMDAYKATLPHNKSVQDPVPFAQESKGKKVFNYTNFKNAPKPKADKVK